MGEAAKSTARGRIIAERYVLGRELGRGGMGTVCQAFDSRLERRVAVKVLDPTAARKPDAIRRFHREALAAGRIGHENICDVRDRGVTAEGLPFIVMELLEGEPLQAILRREGLLPPARAAKLMGQVLSALRAAHEAGIVHRDLKPANVFVIRGSDGHERVKLVDFGISRFQVDTTGNDVTVTGTIMGTPRYMSPEQARGKSDVDERADLWSVGVMLFEAVTGVPPFAGENYNELMFSIVGDDPPLPTELTLGLSKALEAVILKAMAKDRSQRYSSAADFGDELVAVSKGLPAAPTPPPSPAGPGKVERSSPSSETVVNAPGPAAAAGRGRRVGRASPAETTLAEAPTADPTPSELLAALPLGPPSDEAPPPVPPPSPPPSPRPGEADDIEELEADELLETGVAESRRRRWLTIIAATFAVALLLGGAVAVVAARSGGAGGQPSGELSGAGSSEVAGGGDGGQVADGAAPTKSADVRVRLLGVPAGATTTFDGVPVEGDELRGPAGRRGQLDLRAPGYTALEMAVTLDKGLEVDVGPHLERAKEASGGVDAGLAQDEGPTKRAGTGLTSTKGPSRPAKGPVGTRPGKAGSFVKGRHGTKITLEYGD